MDGPDRRGRVLDWLWILVCGGLSSAWCLTAGTRLGPTFDEPIYVQQGLHFWRTGSHFEILRVGTTPLAMDLDALPVYIWERFRGQPFDAANDLDQILPVARAGTLVFWWLLLIYAGRIGRSLAGPRAGRLAVALLACEPNFLAHASLVTADIPVTACLLALVYHFREGREAGWVRRVGVPALWFGIALSVKLTALVFGPLCMGVVELERLWGRGDLYRARLAGCRRDLVAIGGLALVLLFVYCGCDWQPESSFVKWADGLPEGPGRQLMVWLAEHLCIFNNAGGAIVRQFRHNISGHGVYLLGETWQRAIWYYFPVALSIKLTLPMLLLPLAILATRPRALGNWACLCAVTLFFFSLVCRVQIGIRFMLPLIAFGAVGMAAAVVHSCSPTATVNFRAGLRRGFVMFGTAAAVCWMTVSAANVWPQGLCYVNELWGGTDNGYRCLSDSNYDWGQGLPELAEWQREHGLVLLDVWYFGTDPALLRRYPMRRVYFHHVNTLDDVRERIDGRYLAVSATYLYGRSFDSPSYWQTVRLLAERVPVARTRTFFIFDLEGDEPLPSEMIRSQGETGLE